MAYEFIPSISLDANGQEIVDYDNGSLTQREHLHHGLAPQGFEIDVETGEHSVYELEAEQENPDQMMDDYLAAVKEQHPEFPDALVYAQSNLDPELLQHFYSAVDDNDLEDFWSYLEIILAHYEEHLDETSVSLDEEPNEDEVTEDEDEAEIPDLSSLYDAEPSEELRDYYSELADNAEDSATKLLYQLSARFYSGTETQDELIEIALQSGYSRNQLIEAFNQLSPQ